MMQTFTLRTKAVRQRAMDCIQQAPDGYCVQIKAPKRTNDQNALMWELLTQVSIAEPQGRMHTPDTWKSLFMHACGHSVQFELGLDGQPFPVGLSTSKLDKAQMNELIEFIYSWCAEKGVQITEKPFKEQSI